MNERISIFQILLGQLVSRIYLPQLSIWLQVVYYYGTST